MNDSDHKPVSAPQAEANRSCLLEFVYLVLVISPTLVAMLCDAF